MKTTYIGQTKVIEFGGRFFKHCDVASEHVTQAQWATDVLLAPAVTYQNGRNSHVVAGEVLDKAEDGLIDFLVVTA